jgi:hypothetical protein
MAVAGLPASAGAPARPAQAPTPQQVVLRPGDTMRVDGADIGCQVDRRGGSPSIECRRLSGRMRGTYLTVLTSREAMVARFRSARTAKVIFTARHGGPARPCEAAARTCR